VDFAAGQPGDDMALVALRVPRDFVRAAQFDVGGGPQAIARARSELAGMLHDHVDADRLFELQLLVSEVVTNAVRHGGAQHGEHVDLRLSLAGGQVRIEVRDPGPGFVSGPGLPPRPEPTRVGGYGLYLVDLYSARWGVSGDEGSCVWLEVPLAAERAS
jgi:anti-sigma regulatory factor (Ser/Thr protein kinase)